MLGPSLPRARLLLILFAAACGDVSGAPADATIDGGGGGDGDVGGDASPDGGRPPFVRAFHTATQGSAQLLYAADIVDGLISPAVTLSLSGASANPSTTVTMPVVSADGSVVAYAADAVTEGQPGMYLVRYGDTGPEPPLLISDSPSASAYVVSTFLTPDGSKAIYGWGAVGSFGISTVNFYLVNLAGGTPGAPVPLYGGAGTFLINGLLSADGSRFGFIDGIAAYVADLAATSPSGVRISATGVSGTTVAGLALSPNGHRAAYVSDAVVNDVNELWVVDLAGAAPGSPQKASAPLAANHDVAIGYFATPIHIFSSDGGKLAYLEGDLSTYLYELYVVDVSGAVPGAARKVNGTLVSGGGVGDGGTGAIFTPVFRFVPDGRAILYTADQRTDGVFELFYVDLSSAVPGTPQRISGDLVGGGDALDFRIAPDGSGVTYYADQRVDDVWELFYVDLRGGTPTAPQVVNGNLAAGGDLYRYGLNVVVAFSPDGDQLAYAADQTVDQRVDVFLADVSSGVPSAALPVGSATFAMATVPQISFARDGVTLLFTQSAASSSNDLWASDVRGTAPTTPAKVNSGTSVGGFFWLAP